jgi:hypothetical protein
LGRERDSGRARQYHGCERAHGGALARWRPVVGDRFQQNAAVEAAPLEDEVILLDPETNQFCILNKTASAIWTRVAQPATSTEIAADIQAQFADVTEAEALRDVEETLRQLMDLRLITRV